MELDAGVATEIKKFMAQGAFDKALSQLQPLIQAQSPPVEANYMAAVCYRYLKHFDKAQHHLDCIKLTTPDPGRAYQEQGYLLRAQSQFSKALSAFQAATQLNPSLTASWQAQADILQAQSQLPQAEQARWQVQRLKALPKPLLGVTDLIAQGKVFKAEALCKKFLQHAPKNTEGMRLLADIATRLGVLDEAEFLLQSACEFAPNNTQVHISYIQLLRRRQKVEESLAVTTQLLARDPANPQYRSLYAIAKMQLGDYAEAIAAFDKVLEVLPNDAITYTSKGHALKTWGKQSEAIEAYRLALRHNPEYCEAYYSLSNLKTYRFSDEELAAMLKLDEQDGLIASNKVYLYFSLGKAFEDRQDFEPSFNFYSKGNTIKRQQSHYDAALMTEELQAQQRFFSPIKMAALSQHGCADPAPIFIVGLPRAGSTLLEQILSSHSQVDGTAELPNILALAQKLRREGKKQGLGYPEVLDKLSPQEIHQMGQDYINDTAIHRQGASFFIDKMPNNFRHVGLIKTILPNAKIIDARRHPLACCFSGYKQLFAEGQEFSYSLEDIGQYYSDYLNVMDHWQAVIPHGTLLVNYENVIDNIEEQVRKMLDFCGLPFESACLAFHQTERAVRTASSEQVRQPLYKSGLDQWRNYEPYLDALREQLP